MAESELSGAKVASFNSKKRKAQDVALSRSNKKKVKGFYNDKYRELYNSAVAGYFHSPTGIYSQDLSPSQVGSSVWTVAEKDAFFHLLARRGRHSLQAISVGLGSKSETEIRQYNDLLRKGLLDAEHLHMRPSFLKNPTFEAAYEMSSECVALLDRVGEALSLFQQEQDEKTERNTQGQMWLLTRKIGNWVDRRLQLGNDNEKEVSQHIPEANLLNLKCFLWLSKRFFMNSSDLEYNWSSYAENNDEPAILHTAFTDFHTMALGAIKRLVQSTLHIATSRLRAEQHSNDRLQGTITQQDVAAASKILEMRGSMESYWFGVPRRCNLRVFEDGGMAYVSGKSYSHDEVEVLLSCQQRVVNEEVIEDQGDARSEIESLSSAGSEIDDTYDSEFRDDSPSSHHEEETLGEEEQWDGHHDAILERMDQKESHAEEMRLWKLLGKSVEAEQHGTDEENNLEISIATRKDKADLVDWTSWIDYSAEWERLGSPTPVQFSSGLRATRDRHVGDERAHISSSSRSP